MSPWVNAVVAITSSYAVALIYWPAFAFFPKAWIRRLSLVTMPFVPYVGLVVGPEPISYSARCARLFIAVFGSALGAISYLYWQRAARREFLDYARFLWVAMINPQRLILGIPTRPHSKTSLRIEILRMIVAAGVFIATCFAARAVLGLQSMRANWLAAYLSFVVVVVVMATALGQFAWALGRMTGYRGRPLVDQVWLARTPADFWRRWNWLVHWVFYRYFYLPMGGHRHFIWATLFVFLVSGFGHELLVKASLGRMTGHQVAFFLLSGLGVIASPQLERLARFGTPGKVLMRVATIAFMLTTSTLIFGTFSYFVPLLHAPAWLMW